MPALMQLQGPNGNGVGCVGCYRPTTQPTATPLSGGATSMISANPFTAVIAFAFGAFLAWNYTLRPKASRGVSGHRRRHR